MGGDDTDKPDPTPAPVPFTYASAEERDTPVIPEAHSHGGSYTISEAQADTQMPDIPFVQRSEETSAASIAQHGSTSSTFSPQETSIASDPQTPAHATTTYETQHLNSSSHVPPASESQPISSAPATSKPSSTTTTAAPQQHAPSSSDPPVQETQDDQEEIVPIGRALEVDVGLDRS